MDRFDISSLRDTVRVGNFFGNTLKRRQTERTTGKTQNQL